MATPPLTAPLTNMNYGKKIFLILKMQRREMEQRSNMMASALADRPAGPRLPAIGASDWLAGRGHRRLCRPAGQHDGGASDQPAAGPLAARPTSRRTAFSGRPARRPRSPAASRRRG